MHSFDDKKQLTRCKVFINKGVAIVAFEWTKTIQSGVRRLQIPLVNILGSVICPVNAYIRMCKVIPAPDESPVFVLRKHPRGHVLESILRFVLRYVLGRFLGWP